MRITLALLFSFLIGAMTAAAPARDWTNVATPAASGGYRIGNPAAKVKLVEYISYTCPHCRHFTEESAAVLKDKMVRSGSTNIEIRNQIHDKLDFVAVILARCGGAAAFPRLHEAIFAKQEDWVARGADYDRGGAAQAIATPQARARALADASGLSDIATASGISPATLDRCFATTATIDAVVKSASAQRPDVTATPTFLINDGPPQLVTWAGLEPMLRAAGAK